MEEGRKENDLNSYGEIQRREEERGEKRRGRGGKGVA